MHGAARFHGVGTLFMKLFQEKAKELLRVLLVASMHVTKAWQFSDCRIDVFWGESITKIFKVFRLKSKSELVHRSSGVNDFKLAHKQNPKIKSAMASFPKSSELTSHQLQGYRF